MVANGDCMKARGGCMGASLARWRLYSVWELVEAVYGLKGPVAAVCGLLEAVRWLDESYRGLLEAVLWLMGAVWGQIEAIWGLMGLCEG